MEGDGGRRDGEEITTVGPSRERSHHYIPAFHLALFIGLPYRRFHVFDKKWGKYGRPPVADSAVSRDYYALPGETDAERLRLEREFATLENQVAPIIKWLVGCVPGVVPLRDEERDALAGYAAILHGRVPAYRDSALARAQRMASDLESLGLADPIEFRRAAREFGITGTDEELEAKRVTWAEDIQTGRRNIKVHPAISLMVLSTAVEKVRPMLFDREWELLRTDDWPGFVFGDQPVTLLSKGRLAGNIGFGTEDVQVMMPLAPNTLLLVSSRPREKVLEMKVQDRRLGLREPWWATANRVAWLTSKRYIYGQMKRDLQATEAIVDPLDRRRDMHILSAEDEAAALERFRVRHRAPSS